MQTKKKIAQPPPVAEPVLQAEALTQVERKAKKHNPQTMNHLYVNNQVNFEDKS